MNKLQTNFFEVFKNTAILIPARFNSYYSQYLIIIRFYFMAKITSHITLYIYNNVCKFVCQSYKIENNVAFNIIVIYNTQCKKIKLNNFIYNI